MSIAIDGPVASGKSTIGRHLAQSLGYLYLDTGAMYRGVTALVLQHGVRPDDEDAVTEIAKQVHFSFPQLREARAVNPPLLADGVDLTDALRSPEVDRTVSLVSSYRGVREAMVQQQRRIGQTQPVVMVGRDIGTVVLPDAEVKIFLTASVEERAARRNAERRAAGLDEPYEVTLEDLRLRDRRDSERTLSPLRAADDAVRFDSTGLSLAASAQAILHLVRERLEQGRSVRGPENGVK